MKDLSTIDDSEDLEKQLAQLRKELHDTISKKETLERSMEESQEELRKENVVNENFYEDLLSDIEGLEVSLNVPPEIRSDTSKSKTKPKIKKDIDAKALYRKISRLCHPDKTDDVEKHKLYVEANKAYEENDGEQLEYLYSVLIEQNEVKFEKRQKEDLERAIESLRKKLKKEIKDYDELTSSLGYIIHKRYTSDAVTKQMQARHQYSELLFRKIEQAARKKEELESKITENENNL
jgi:hypothetical protein